MLSIDLSNKVLSMNFGTVITPKISTPPRRATGFWPRSRVNRLLPTYTCRYRFTSCLSCFSVVFHDRTLNSVGAESQLIASDQRGANVYPFRHLEADHILEICPCEFIHFVWRFVGMKRGASRQSPMYRLYESVGGSWSGNLQAGESSRSL